MASFDVQRKLTAILCTDVAAYSRLMGADEEGTIAALKALRADLIDPKIAQRQGRIVKPMGDGMVAEFPSVEDAVRTADVAVNRYRCVTSRASSCRVDVAACRLRSRRPGRRGLAAETVRGRPAR